MENKLTILHLTDIHISYLEKPEVTMRKWNNLIYNILSMKSIKIDLVAITGDLTSHGEKREFHVALAYINWFCKVCKIPKKKVVFCPGNHDADKGCEQSTFCHYDSFIKEFYGDLLISASENANQDLQILQNNIRIWSINTNLTTSYVFYDNASIPEKDANEILKKSNSININILLMHHPTINISNERTFREICKKMDIILCGHLHPNKPRVQICDKATIITGMAMTPHLETIQRGCQLVMINRGIVTVEPIYDQNLYHFNSKVMLQKCGS